MSANVFQHTHRVTYAECTMGNHVYYARYLDLLETARGEFFRRLGMSFLQWQERDFIFPVIECHLQYKSAAHYDDMLAVEVWVTAVERVRLHFAYRILNPINKVILEAETHHVCASTNQRPKRLPEELSKLLQPYLHTPAAS